MEGARCALPGLASTPCLKRGASNPVARRCTANCGSRCSAFVGHGNPLQQHGCPSQRCAAAVVRRAAPAPLASAAPVAQPLLRAVGRLAARALGSGALLNLARGARGALSGRAGPFVFAGLVAYSIAVTLYAAQASRSANTAASAGSSSSSSVAGTIDPPRDGLETVAGAVEAEADAAAPQSFAEAVAATSVADLAQPASAELERKLQKARAAAAASAAAPAAPKKEDRVVCKVCGGSGQVSYENHMTSTDGTICPCCLGKGSVKNANGHLLSCLLSFDP